MSDQWEPKQDDDVDQPESELEYQVEDDAGALSEDLAEFAGDELEAAYLKAMSALDAIEAEISVDSSITELSTDDRDELDLDESQISPSGSRSAESSIAEATSDLGQSASVESQTASLAELFSQPGPVNPPDSGVVNVTPDETRVTPRQIIEACLFVGGSPLTSSKLSGVLRGEFDSDFVEREIDELNRSYAAENRPYEIRLGDGGHRLALREEFERIRYKVYGLGPKEVRLSQEALEVLAVVAYHQPIKQARVEELGKPGCGAVLRQLVRRELLAVERDPAQPREVSYKTTPRFLLLFGIRDLEELPRHEQVAYK